MFTSPSAKHLVICGNNFTGASGERKVAVVDPSPNCIFCIYSLYCLVGLVWFGLVWFGLGWVGLVGWLVRVGGWFGLVGLVG